MSELVDKDAFLKQERKWYCENCDRRKGVKNGRKCFVYEIGDAPCRACDVDDVLDDLECFETIDTSPWHRVEEPPKDRQKCFIAYKGPLGFIYECATYYDDINIGLGDDVYKDRTHGFVSYDEWGATSIDADYWMPIEPPKEDMDGERREG